MIIFEKQIKFIIFTVMLLIAIQSNASSLNASAAAYITPPLSIAEITPLQFGNIILGHKSSDSVTMGHNGNMSSTANLALFNGSRSAGQFMITGEPFSTVSIQFNDFSDLVSSGNTMKLRGFTTPDRHPTLDENGTINISIGARIIINPNQATGTYQGSYPITVSYQ